VEYTVSVLERRIKQAHPEIRRISVEAQSREDHLRAAGTSPPVPGAADEATAPSLP